MSQTRQNSAAHIIKLLKEVNSIRTPGISEKFIEIESILFLDPNVMYTTVDVTINNQIYTLSPLQFSFGRLDIYAHHLFFGQAIHSRTLEKFDNQILAFDWGLDVSGYFHEYDDFSVMMQTMQQNGKSEEEINAAAVSMLGNAERVYPRIIWDDILQKRANANPKFNYTLDGKNLADDDGEEKLGEDYYVLITDDADLVPVPEATKTSPQRPEDVLLQRDTLLGYVQTRLDELNVFIAEARVREQVRAGQRAELQAEYDKENQRPRMYN